MPDGAITKSPSEVRMIIFGTRGVTYSSGKGDFFCPTCRGETPYSHKRVRRFFTLYFIPVIPLDLHGEYVECQQCRGTYAMGVLDYDPEASAAEFEAEYHRAVMQVMVDMMLADGNVDDEEIAVMRRIYGQLTDREISEQEVRAQIAEAEAEARNLGESLEELAPHLNDSGKEMVLKAAFLVAVADGEFHDEEKAMLATVGRSLGMSAAHIKGVFTSMQSEQ
jgi:tellurite resistance protein